MMDDKAKITIRTIERPDPETVYRLIQQLDHGVTFELFKEYLTEMLAQNYFMVAALKEGEMVGVAGCWTATKLYCGRYLEIDHFIVDEAYRGQAIGARMMEHILEEAKRRHCDSVTLNAYIRNEAAHKFYDKYQFETVGKHRILRIGGNASPDGAS